MCPSAYPKLVRPRLGLQPMHLFSQCGIIRLRGFDERLLTFPHLKQCTLMLLMTALSARAAIKKSHTPNDHASKALPLMIAHRAGTKDYPENTLLAINEALKNGADLIWVTVQLSKGGIPVLYQPADLSAWTEANGAVADKT